VDPSNNRFLENQYGDANKEYEYDLAGNLTRDAEGRRFLYDAENRQTEVRDSSGAVVAYYSYDGDGRRVKKTAYPGTPQEATTVFVYDLAGRLAEERTGPGAVLETSYTYAGSRLLATETAAGTNYLTADHLGTPRINTDQTGAVTARHDYLPFGEEIARSGYGIPAPAKVSVSDQRPLAGVRTSVQPMASSASFCG
jgi:YD repeat-containing protein